MKLFILYQTDQWKSRASRIYCGIFDSRDKAADSARYNGLYTPDSAVSIVEVTLNQFEETWFKKFRIMDWPDVFLTFQPNPLGLLVEKYNLPKQSKTHQKTPFWSNLLQTVWVRIHHCKSNIMLPECPYFKDLFDNLLTRSHCKFASRKYRNSDFKKSGSRCHI